MSTYNTSQPTSRTSSVASFLQASSRTSSNSSFASYSSRSSSVSSTTSYPSRTSSVSSEADTLHLPRIICLHGGGVSARIFRAQCRELVRRLTSFRLVFVDAPFLSEPGPGMIPCYENFGPFRRWVRFRDSQADIGDAATVQAITDAIDLSKAQDAGYGAWVGILGFSQGAKMAASILYRQQLEKELYGLASTDYKFGVIMAGSGPLISMTQESDGFSTLMRAGAMTLREWQHDGVVPHKLRIPTIHVHGLKDPGLEKHRCLMRDYFELNSNETTLVEWDGDHRLPIKTKDVEKVVVEISRVARETGADDC